MREIDKPFLMSVEDVFSIKGRGTVGTGRIERGSRQGRRRASRSSAFAPTLQGHGLHRRRDVPEDARQGEAGDNVGVLLRGVEKDEIERGMVLASAEVRSRPHTKFEGEVYVLTKEEGGRHTPFFNGYRPQFYFRTTDVTGSVELPGGAEMCMPGDNVRMQTSS